MNLFNIFFIISQVFTNGQMLVGSQRDDHGCVLDGGYQWCESTSSCERPWETPCSVAIDPLPPSPPPPPTVIPSNCNSWFDGCNRCQVRDAQMVGCTRMMCLRQGTPRCLTYNTQTLNIGDICYRFCEDNSSPMVNHMNDCPPSSVCRAPQSVGYDSCHDRAWRCVAGH